MTDHVVQTLTEMLGLDEDHIAPAIIRELLVEQYEKARCEHIRRFNGDVWLGVDSAESGDEMRYHREPCTVLAESGIDRFSVPLSMASKVGYLSCPSCVDLNVAQWAQSRAVDPVLVTRVMQSEDTKLFKGDALILLRAIREPPHPSLRRWEQDQITILAVA